MTDSPETNLAKLHNKKEWQPVNIVFGLLIIGCIFYFTWRVSSFLAIARMIPIAILVMTRKNNIFAAIVLFLFGLTLFLLPTFDAFLLLVAGVYMFVSALLRMFKVKRYIVIGLATAVVFGLWAFNVLVLEKMQTFIPENSLVITKGIDSANSIVLSPTKMPPTGEVKDTSTTFNPGQDIYPIEKGLQKNIDYTCRVISKAGEVVIPTDKWPVSKITGNGNIAQGGDFKNFPPLHIGDYTIQLVKVEDKQGIIVAERDFSIVPYDEQTISEVVAYLTSGSDPGQKYYDSYTVKTDSIDITAWVQAPKGETISGTVKFYKTNYDGVVEKTPWDSERSFTTNSNGEPLSVGGISGKIYPGIWHLQILVNDKIFKDLKFTIQ